MATNKVKFKMSIKEISFEFEGHYEQGKALQQGISQALTGITKLQNQATGADDNGMKAIEGKVTNSAPLPSRRRRRRHTNAKSEDADISEGANKAGALNDELPFGESKAGSAHPRSTGVSPTALLEGLCKEGFFQTPRTSGEIKNELHRKGFSNIRSSDLTSPVISLTRQGTLQRDKDSQRNQWVYITGNNSGT